VSWSRDTPDSYRGLSAFQVAAAEAVMADTVSISITEAK